MANEQQHAVHIQFAEDIGSIKSSVQNLEKIIERGFVERSNDHVELKKKVETLEKSHLSLKQDYKSQKARFYGAIGVISFVTGMLGDKLGEVLRIFMK